jgi:hypothetical protein
MAAGRIEIISPPTTGVDVGVAVGTSALWLDTPLLLLMSTLTRSIAKIVVARNTGMKRRIFEVLC